jgi:hydroxypyruvate isomerase
MFPLSYNTNGLVNLSLERAIEEVSKAGYEGIEISLHPNHLLPFGASRSRLDQLKDLLATQGVKPVSLATGHIHLLGDVAFEPSLISPHEQGRRKRIELMKVAIDIANYLSIPCVNFVSGIRQEGVTEEEAAQMLQEGVRACLKDAGQVTLVMEPDPLMKPLPPMFIRTVSQAISVIKEVNSPHFRLNLEIAHLECVEGDVCEHAATALPYTRHIHIADIKGRIHHHEIPGEGDIDFRSLFKVLKKGDYRHYLSVELYWHIDDWERALYQARKHLLDQMMACEADN